MYLGEPKKICCFIVKQGVNWWNLLVISLTPCTVMLMSTYWNAQVFLLLRNEDYFNVDKDDIGRVSSLLILCSYPIGAVGTIFAGYIYDIVGRRFTLSVAFLCSASLLIAVPYAPTLLVLFIMRMVY